jgi:hypothetical protein
LGEIPSKGHFSLTNLKQGTLVGGNLQMIQNKESPQSASAMSLFLLTSEEQEVLLLL